MKVEKIINNNIVKSLDKHKQEIIVMGCGIGFGKKIGDEIDESKIEKVYLKKDENNQFEDVLKHIDLSCFKIANEIIEKASKTLDRKLSDNIFLTLCDHISFSLERFKNNLNLTNVLLNEIKRFYNQEYLIGLEALEIIKKHSGCLLPEDEAGFIAMHIVSATTDENILKQSKETLKIISSVVDIVKYHFNIELDENSIHYERFITHLKFFIKRIFENLEVNESGDEEFFLLVKKQYKKEYACVMKIYNYLLKEYNIKIHNDEIIYLTIHIKKITTKLVERKD